MAFRVMVTSSGASRVASTFPGYLVPLVGLTAHGITCRWLLLLGHHVPPALIPGYLVPLARLIPGYFVPLVILIRQGIPCRRFFLLYILSDSLSLTYSILYFPCQLAFTSL